MAVPDCPAQIIYVHQDVRWTVGLRNDVGTADRCRVLSDQRFSRKVKAEIVAAPRLRHAE